MMSKKPSDFRKAEKKLGEYLRRFSGSTSSFSEKSTSEMLMSTTSVSYANVSTQVAVVLPRGQASPDVLFSAGVCPLPKENLLPFYRQLLVWNYFQTDIAHFAVNDEQGVVSLVSRRPVEGFDYQEFAYIVGKMSAVTLNTIMILRKQFGV